MSWNLTDNAIVRAGLSRTMTTFRWDISSHRVIMTQESPAAQALMFEKGVPYYDAYSRELVSSFRQAKRVHLDNVDELPGNTSGGEAAVSRKINGRSAANVLRIR